MRWYIKLIRDDGDSVFIAYSYERNKSCDGVLKYSKSKRDITIEKMSDGADDYETRDMFQFVYRFLANGGIPREKKCICIG